MEKVDEARGGYAERGDGGGDRCRLRQAGVVLGFAVLLVALVAQVTWSQYQLRDMEERLKSLEKGMPPVPFPPDEDTTTFIIRGSKQRSERAAKYHGKMKCTRTPSQCMQFGEKPSAHLVPACDVGPRAILTDYFNHNTSIIENFWTQNNSCPPAYKQSTSHMNGGMFLYHGSILMVPCPGFYYVYAQMGLKQEFNVNNTVGVALMKVCFASSSTNMLILEKYSLPSYQGGFPFLAGTFNMTCNCGFALSTPLRLPSLRVSTDNYRSYFGAFLVDGTSFGGTRS